MVRLVMVWQWFSRFSDGLTMAKGLVSVWHGLVGLVGLAYEQCWVGFCLVMVRLVMVRLVVVWHGLVGSVGLAYEQCWEGWSLVMVSLVMVCLVVVWHGLGGSVGLALRSASFGRRRTNQKRAVQTMISAECKIRQMEYKWKVRSASFGRRRTNQKRAVQAMTRAECKLKCVGAGCE